MSEKIKTRRELVSMRQEFKRRDKSVVFTNGCFDILHGGHIALFHEAKRHGDILIVAVNTDDTIQKLKGPDRPIFPLAERLEVLAALRDIDYLVPFAEETPLRIISALLPDVLVKGGDWKPEDVVGKTQVESAGGRVVIFPYIQGLSTSDIIEKIKHVKISGSQDV
jgi:D-beta-D-heptose 7-phosphate kinase/D-beta-D-heptose 1-phosphate adenosyltransferase